MFGLTCSVSFLGMTVCHHVLKYLDLSEDLILKFLKMIYIWMITLAVLILLKNALNFIYK